MRGDLGDVVELKVRILPDWLFFLGNDEESPIDKLVNCVIQVENLHGPIGIDVKKILMNPNDYQKLYLMFHEYCILRMKKSYRQWEVDNIWRKCSPRSIKKVPEGHVFLYEGYIFIE